VDPTPFGKYLLLERLAAGGMGEVFLAKGGSRGVERFFAIKRILSHFAESDHFIEMMFNEAKITITLHHPNIAQVFEFGEIEDHFFLAMEYVEGLSLHQVIGRGRQSGEELRIPDVVYVIMQLAKALDYAHNKRGPKGEPLNIIHRDISPHNILLDEKGSVKLIDFGVAKAASNRIQTDASTIKGKIPYMSPEQAGGLGIDARSDLYAVGIVLFECLTYERLYPSRDTFETFRQVQTGDVRNWREKIHDDVPACVVDILDKTLQADREDRYANAAELEKALAKALHEIAPGYTAHGLEETLGRLDVQAEERKDKLRDFADLAMPDDVEPMPLPASPTTGEWGEPTTGTMDEEMPTKALIVGREPEPVAHEGGSKLPLVAAVVAVVLAVGAAVGFAIQPSDAPPPPIPDAPPIPEAPAVEATQVALLSKPDGATVSVNGQLKGATPMKLEVKSSELPLELRFEKEGFEPETVTLDAAALDEPVGVVLTEKKRRPAARPRPIATEPKPTPKPVATTAPASKECVTILVDPWAHVRVGGKKVGTTPIQCLKMSVGTHKVVLENPALGAKRTVSVEVRAGVTSKIFERL
jgi:serine/threonine-protein kinase